jgi:molecular chaperone GrpE
MDNKQNTKPGQEQPQNVEANDSAQDNNQPEAQQPELTETEKLQKDLDETRAALEKEKKEYLFLMADFDNFRKRVLKEKADLIKNAGEKTLLGILPIVDDFERGLDATKDAEGAVREGMELIYQKLVKYLADNGVKEMVTEVATDFDADLHEAIAIVPAPAEDLKGKIIDTTQKGYTINDKVLRHAKVVVGQ